MRNNDVNYMQSILIDNFNRFVQAAEKWLGIKIEPLNERGCCFALAQYNIKYAREGALPEFYEFIRYINSQFTDNNIVAMLTKAKFSEEDFEALEKTGEKQKLRYNNFKLEKSPYNFKQLMNFVEGLSKAQVGYVRKMNRGRFRAQTGQANLGAFENIAGNWDNNFIMHGNKQAILTALQNAHLEDHNYAIIVSGQHAINYRKIGPNQFVVYDSNDSITSKTLHSLEEIAQTIVDDFAKVGHLSPEDEVSIAIRTASFGSGGIELHKAVMDYRKSLMYRRVELSDFGVECHEIALGKKVQGDYLDKAAELYKMFQEYKNGDKSKNMQDFTHSLPPSLQNVVNAYLRYYNDHIFANIVESRTSIYYDREMSSSEQQSFMDNLNEYFAQYHGGFLSRADFALNALNLIDEFMQNKTPEDLNTHFPYSEITQLRSDMSQYLENTITSVDLINSCDSPFPQSRDGCNCNIFYPAMVESPNLATIQALFADGGPAVHIQFDPNNEKDNIALIYFLRVANPKAVEYLMSKIDLNQLLTKPASILLKEVLNAKNYEVAKLLLKLRNPPLDINTKFGDKNLLDYAISGNSHSFAQFLIEQGAVLTTKNLDDMIRDANEGRMLNRYRIMQEKQNDHFEQFKDAIKEQKLSADQVKALWEEAESAFALGVANGQIQAEVITPEYTYEQFKEEYQEDFKSANNWFVLIEKIADHGTKADRDNIFQMACNCNNNKLAEKVLAMILSQNPELKEEHDAKRLVLLQGAVKSGEVEIVKRLLDQDPQLVNAQMQSAMSVLCKACEDNNLELVKLLIRNGANVSEGVPSPLFFAAKSGNKDLCMQILNQGAKVDTNPGLSAKTPLIGLMTAKIPTTEKAELFKLLYRDIDLNDLDLPMFHNTILAMARSPNVTADDMDMFLANFRDIKRFRINLSEIYQEDGNNLAMICLLNKNLGLAAQFLKTVNTDLSYKNHRGETPFSMVMMAIQQQEVFRRTRDVRYNMDMHNGLIKLARGWIENKDNATLIKTPFNDGRSALMWGIQARNKELVQALIDQHVNVNYIKSANPDAQGIGETALHIAVTMRDDEAVAMLLEANADVLVRDMNGCTPMLRMAKELPTMVNVKALLDEQKLDATDNEGNTMLHLAVAKVPKNAAFTRALLKAGLDPLQPNAAKPPKTALEIAFNKNQEIHFPALLAILEHLPAAALRKNPQLKAALKPYKKELFDRLQLELGKAQHEDPKIRQELLKRVGNFIDNKNAAGWLFRTKLKKVQQEGDERKLLPNFEIDNKWKAALKKFKKDFLEEKKEKPFEQIPRKRGGLRNL